MYGPDSRSTLFWFHNYLNISHLVAPVLHSLSYFTQSPLPSVHIRVLHQADVPHLNISLVRVPLLTDEERGKVQFQPHLPKLVGNGLDKQKPGFYMLWILSKHLITLISKVVTTALVKYFDMSVAVGF